MRRAWTRSWDRVYCCQLPDIRTRALSFLRLLQEKQRADERTRIAFLLQLRVIIQALQGFAGDCKCRIFRGISFACLAACCTVLRSRWCQSGVRTSDSYSPTAGPMASPRDRRSHNPPTPVSRAFPALQIADGRSRRELDRRTAQHCLLGLSTQRRSRVASRIPSFEKVVLRRSRR